MKLTIELDREADGRWIADIPELPGVVKYGPTKAAAIQAAVVLALQVIASEIEHGERSADIKSIEFAPAGETAKAA